MTATTPARSGHDILMGASGPAYLSFGQVPGVEKGGKVVAGPTPYHATEFNALNPGKGAPKYYSDGNPVMGVHIDVETNERDPANRDDDGVRRFWVEKTAMRYAIADAIKATGASHLEIGGYLYITWTGSEPGQGAEPKKTYSARYVPAGAALLSPPSPVAPPAATGALPPGWPPAVAAPPAAAPPAARTPSPQPVPLAVYSAMVNAGLDVTNFIPIPG